LKKHNNSGKKSEPTSKRKKSRGAVQRDTKEVLAELVGKLKAKLDPKQVVATGTGEKHQSGELRPNLDRLTVGVDLGDQGSHYCILGLEGDHAGGRTVAEDAGGFGNLLPRVECGVGGGGSREQAMETLPERSRLILVLSAMDGHLLEELAELLQVPLGTVNSRLHTSGSNHCLRPSMTPFAPR
jgi:hypothetical protein